MGLDTSHNCFHGAYSSFNSFRHSLAQQIGINLDDYHGYGKGGTRNLTDIKHDIMPLLNHSDCDGELSPEEALQIKNGLNDILNNFNPNIEAAPNFKNKIIQFRDGLNNAISNNEVVTFN